MRINDHTADVSNNLKIKFNQSKAKNSSRVNINNLMLKVRADHKKKKKENLFFVSLIGSIVLITGIIASL